MDAVSWQGPPREVLGQAVPIQQFVARTDRVAAALHYAVAFPEGCLLALHVAIRRGSLDDPAWKRVTENEFDCLSGLETADGGLKFGVRFPDGSKATTVEHPFPGWARPADRPERPMLVEAGGDSSGGDQYYDSHRRLWLWPLPPPGPFEFVAEWPDLGIDRTSATLDGNAIVRAAAHAVPLWG
ncbi:hypothetical protein [Amycolatopsis sp. NPDC054798]